MDKLTTIISQIRGNRSQAKFARLLGISTAAVSRYESGQRIPSTQTVAALLQIAEPEQQRDLLEALGVDVDQFATALLASAGVMVIQEAESTDWDYYESTKAEK